MFSAFHLHLSNCPFPSHAPSSLPWFFCLSFGSRKTGRFESSRSPLLDGCCQAQVLKPTELHRQKNTFFFFCGPVWHLNRVICFGIIWLREKGLRIVLSSDILGRDKNQKFVVLKERDIVLISYTLCKLSFWWFVKEVAKVIWMDSIVSSSFGLYVTTGWANRLLWNLVLANLNKLAKRSNYW